MDFSNLDKKFNSVLGPSTLSDVLNDNSCPRLPWLTFRFKPENQDSIFLEKWKLQHASALNNLITFLKSRHPEATIDSEVKLPTVQFLGVKLFGIIDCIVKFPNGDVGIFDAKTGARKSAHWFQIGIYYLMLKAIARNQGLPIPSLFSLGLFYNDGKVPPVENTFKDNLIELTGPNSIDEIFLDGTRKRLQEVLEITSQEQLPEARPSINNCRFCKFNNKCPSAIKSDLTIVAESLF